MLHTKEQIRSGQPSEGSSSSAFIPCIGRLSTYSNGLSPGRGINELYAFSFVRLSHIRNGERQHLRWTNILVSINGSRYAHNLRIPSSTKFRSTLPHGQVLIQSSLTGSRLMRIPNMIGRCKQLEINASCSCSPCW